MIGRWILPTAFALLSIYAFWRFHDWWLSAILALNVPINLPARRRDDQAKARPGRETKP